MKNTLILVLCFYFIPLFSQDIQNPRVIHKNGIVLSGGGPGVYGSISYTNFIKSTINFELGAGPATVFSGIKYHIGGQKDHYMTPYIGGYGIYIWLFDIFDDDDNELAIGGYIPVGIHYLSNGGFSFAIEAGALAGAGNIIPFGSVKAGYHF